MPMLLHLYRWIWECCICHSDHIVRSDSHDFLITNWASIDRWGQTHEYCQVSIHWIFWLFAQFSRELLVLLIIIKHGRLALGTQNLGLDGGLWSGCLIIQGFNARTSMLKTQHLALRDAQCMVDIWLSEFILRSWYSETWWLLGVRSLSAREFYIL